MWTINIEVIWIETTLVVNEACCEEWNAKVIEYLEICEHTTSNLETSNLHISKRNQLS